MLVAPELVSLKAVFKNTGDKINYHEAKWNKILQKKNNPAIIRLLAVLAEIKITHECKITGILIFVGIHAPKLSS